MVNMITEIVSNVLRNFLNGWDRFCKVSTENEINESMIKACIDKSNHLPYFVWSSSTIFFAFLSRSSVFIYRIVTAECSTSQNFPCISQICEKALMLPYL